MSWPLGIAAGQVGHSWLGAVFSWRIPFVVSSVYCLLTALAVLVLYRAPLRAQTGRTVVASRLNAQEWRLILCAGLAWAFLNGGYVVYLSFGPVMLEALGQPPLTAAWVISIGSWLTLLSFAVCGQIVDRFGYRNAVLTVCTFCAMGALGLLCLPGGGLTGSILFGLFGLAPAGVVMALAGEALRPQNRAFGMGVFFTIYYAVMLAVPPLAGRILDATGDVRVTIVFGVALFGGVLPAVWMYRRYRNAPGQLSSLDALGNG
jgi:predicted MFS family arabinose efflux permease